MKAILPLLFVATLAMAQAPTQSYQLPAAPQVSAEMTESNVPVSHSDLYCAGFLATQRPAPANVILGGHDSPMAAEFGQNEFIFLRGTLTPGTRVSMLREVRNANPLEEFRGQKKLLAQAGRMYVELGYANIVENRGKNVSVARIEFSCQPTMPGDIAVPFVEKQNVSFRRVSQLDRYPEKSDAAAGRILAMRDFNTYASANDKVYVDLGTGKGLKPGDLLRVVRAFDHDAFDQADAVSMKVRDFDYTQKTTAEEKAELRKPGDLPRKVVGELVVLTANANSATAMVTFATDALQVGDGVELESPGQ